jgi:hypothetical protein
MSIGRALVTLTATILLQACGGGKSCPEAVTKAQYADLERCWGGVQRFSSRLALTRKSDGTYQPTFISKDCLYEIEDLPKWAAIAQYPRIPHISGDEGLAKAHGLLDQEITDNYKSSHLAGPKRTSRIYEFEGRLDRLADRPNDPVFRIVQISRLEPTGQTMGDLVEESCYR